MAWGALLVALPDPVEFEAEYFIVVELREAVAERVVVPARRIVVGVVGLHRHHFLVQLIQQDRRSFCMSRQNRLQHTETIFYSQILISNFQDWKFTLGKPKRTLNDWESQVDSSVGDWP